MSYIKRHYSMWMDFTNDVLKNCLHRIAGLALRSLFVIIRGNDYVRNQTFYDHDYVKKKATIMWRMEQHFMMWCNWQPLVLQNNKS